MVEADTSLKPGIIKHIAEIPVTRIGSGGNFRLDLGDLSGLKNSMKSLGQRMPIEVAYDPDNDKTPYLLVDGHRRVAAALALGWTNIIANVSVYENSYSRDVASLSCNMARDDLTTYEIAAALNHFSVEYGLSGAALSKRMGELFAGTRRPYTRQHVNKLLRAFENSTPEFLEYWRKKSDVLALNTDVYPVAALSAPEQIEWLTRHVGPGEGANAADDGNGEKNQKKKKKGGFRKPHITSVSGALESLKNNEIVSSTSKMNVDSTVKFCLGMSKTLVVDGELIYDIDAKLKDKEKTVAKKNTKSNTRHRRKRT